METIGEVENYEDIFLLCYVRGPEGIIGSPSGSAPGTVDGALVRKQGADRPGECRVRQLSR